MEYELKRDYTVLRRYICVHLSNYCLVLDFLDGGMVGSFTNRNAWNLKLKMVVYWVVTPNLKIPLVQASKHIYLLMQARVCGNFTADVDLKLVPQGINILE